MFDGCDVTVRPGSGPAVPWGGQMLGGEISNPWIIKYMKNMKLLRDRAGPSIR